LDFVAAVVVDERAPVGMRALARIGMLVEMRAVELSEAVSIAGKMRRGPIENDADAGPVAAVDELHESFGSAKAAGGREIAEGLVSPGGVVRMFHDGKQFDVGVTEFFDVRDELVCKFAVVEPAIVVFRDATPRAEMNFVDGNRRLEPVLAGALRDPIGVVPVVGVEAGDDLAGSIKR
jgi:hypothetical protein